MVFATCYVERQWKLFYRLYRHFGSIISFCSEKVIVMLLIISGEWDGAAANFQTSKVFGVLPR